MKKAYFFDLDVTLADTDADIRGAWKAALKDLGLECPDFDSKFATGPSIDDVARTLFPGRCDEKLIACIRRAFGFRYDTDGFPSTKEYPGVLDRVRELKASGARVFIATNKRYAGASAMCEKFGWNRIFEKLYASDMHKDDPAIGKLRKGALLALALRENALAAADCAMVGDTANDFAAARENGMESVAVAWGYGTPGELAGADRIVRTPAGI